MTRHGCLHAGYYILDLSRQPWEVLLASLIHPAWEVEEEVRPCRQVAEGEEVEVAEVLASFPGVCGIVVVVVARSAILGRDGSC
jgi:hypothetical protein